MERCGSCGAGNAGDAEYCLQCGAHLGRFRKCMECGIVNKPDASSCRMCGAKLTSDRKEVSSGPKERPGFRPRSVACAKCGQRYDANMVECPYCERSEPDTYDPTSRSSGLPTAAGTLLFVAGILCIIMGFLIMGDLGDMTTLDIGEVQFCSFIELLFGVVAITGWVFCMHRSHLVYVLAVCVLTLFSVGPFFLSSLLGLVALILVAISAKEFR